MKRGKPEGKRSKVQRRTKERLRKEVQSDEAKLDAKIAAAHRLWESRGRPRPTTRRGRARSEAPAESGPRPPSGGTPTPKARRKTGLNAFKRWEQKYGVGPRRRGGTEERWRNLQQYLQKTKGLAGQVRALDTKIRRRPRTEATGTRCRSPSRCASSRPGPITGFRRRPERSGRASGSGAPRGQPSPDRPLQP